MCHHCLYGHTDTYPLQQLVQEAKSHASCELLISHDHDCDSVASDVVAEVVFQLVG